MTQIGRYGHMLKVQIDDVKMTVKLHYRVEGSVMANSVRGQMVGVQAEIHLASKEDPARVARVLHNARNGCFVHQALTNPVPVTDRVILNGSGIEVAQLFKP